MRGIEIRQFTHSAEIKREIPFCTRKRSETYIFPQYLAVNVSIYLEHTKFQQVIESVIELSYTVEYLNTQMLNRLSDP